MIWKRHLTLDELNATSDNTMVAHLGIVYTRLGDDVLEAEILELIPVLISRLACCMAARRRRWLKRWDRYRIYDDP